MAMEKTTDWPREKEAAARNIPLAERINPDLHKIAKTQKGDARSAAKSEKAAALAGNSSQA